MDGVDHPGDAPDQNIIDSAGYPGYLERQTQRLEQTAEYLPAHYVEQHGVVTGAGADSGPADDVLAKLVGLLEAPEPRFALILGDAGTGKTFLLREIARRLGEAGRSGPAQEPTPAPPATPGAILPALLPVLIDLQSLVKVHTLDAIIAQHLASSGMDHIDLPAFRQLLAAGRLVLLFDGFDDLASRVTRDRAAEYFNAILRAGSGRAKFVIATRSPHFLSAGEGATVRGEHARPVAGYCVIRLRAFDFNQAYRFLLIRSRDEEAADRRFAVLDDVKDVLELSTNPRMLTLIADIDEAQLLDARKEHAGRITPAALCRLALDRWIDRRLEIAHSHGAAPNLDKDWSWKAITELARRLWETAAPSLDLADLPQEIGDAVRALTPAYRLRATLTQSCAAATLLVREEDGRFSLVHPLVLEWLVAQEAAREAKETGRSSVLAAREISDLMADFFAELAGRDAAASTARQALGGSAGKVAPKNAFRILTRMGVGAHALASFAGQDLRGQNLSGKDLRRADLRGADLTAAKLVEANLTGAQLQGAKLVRTDLSRAVLREANLAGADGSGARFMGADLRGAALRGAKLRITKLVGCTIEPVERVDSIEPALDRFDGCDTFGAALPGSVAIEATVATSSPCNAVAFSSDGALLASAHDDGAVRLWDAATGSALRVLKGHSSAVTSLAFSPDSRSLASASTDTTVILWNVASGSQLHVLGSHSSVVTAAASASATASASASAPAPAPASASASASASAPASASASGTSAVTSVAFSPDSLSLASSSWDTTITLWSVATGAILRTLKGHSDAVTSVAFSPDGLSLASTSDDKTVILWDLPSGSSRRLLEGHSRALTSVAFSPDGSSLAIASNDTTVTLWSVASNTVLRVLAGHSSAVTSVAWSPDGLSLASGSDDKTVHLWNVASGTSIRALEGHSNAVMGVALSPDGLSLASASTDTTVTLWTVASGAPIRVLKGHSNAVLSVAFGPDGLSLASAHADNTITLWDIVSGSPVHTLKGSSFFVASVAFSPDGLSLASAFSDKTITVWDVASGTPLGALNGHTGAVRGVAFGPDGLSLASASADKTVTLWDVASDSALHVFHGHSNAVRAVAFGPDGLSLASASTDKTIILWDVTSRSARHVLEGHSSAVTSVAFSPDGHSLASASEDRTIILWSVASGSKIRVLEGPHTITGVTFSPDGLSLASAGDRTITLRDVASGSVLRTFNGHSSMIRSIAFSPDGLSLASASDDGTVRLWDIAGALRATLWKLPEGWAAFTPDGRYQTRGNTGGAFWHTIGLCRFEPGELDPYLPRPLRVPDGQPLLPPPGQKT